MRTIYNSLIHPHLTYGLYLWGFSPKRLTVLQKKAVRILSLRPFVSHSTPLFKNLKILKIEDQYSIQLYKLYYKNTNNLLPHYFNSFTPYYNNQCCQLGSFRMREILFFNILTRKIWLFERTHKNA